MNNVEYIEWMMSNGIEWMIVLSKLTNWNDLIEQIEWNEQMNCLEWINELNGLVVNIIVSVISHQCIWPLIWMNE